MARQAYIEITQEALAEMLVDALNVGLPKNAELVTIRINSVNDNLVLIWEHESFPESEGIQRVPWKQLPRA